MNLTILIEAKYIPDGSTVFKPTGTYPYTLKNEIKIYSEDSKPQIIKNDGCKFMVSDGNINVIPESKILKWETDLDTLNCIFGDKDN